MKKYALIGSVLSLSVLSGCADYPVEPVYSQPPPPPTFESYVDAPVTYVNPVYSQVAVPHPVQRCWQQQVPNVSVGGALIGGLAGGLLGHTIGRGGGNVAATAGGAVVGAVVGNNIATQNEAPGTETRCQTDYENTYEPRVTSYDVTYTLDGRTYHTNLPYNPGSSIRVKSSVRPVY